MKVILPPFRKVNDTWAIFIRAMVVRSVKDGSRKRVGLW